MTSALGLLLLMGLLQVKHLFADYIWQSNEMVRKKGKYGNPVGASHSALHSVLTVGVLILVTPLSLGLVLLVAVLEFLVHYHTDWAKDYFTALSGKSPREKGYWILVGLDQFMHQITYVAIVGVVLIAAG